MKKLPFISSSLLTSTLLTAGHAFGGAECPEAPQSQWLSKIDMQKKSSMTMGLPLEASSLTIIAMKFMVGKPMRKDQKRDK